MAVKVFEFKDMGEFKEKLKNSYFSIYLKEVKPLSLFLELLER